MKNYVFICQAVLGMKQPSDQTVFKLSCPACLSVPHTVKAPQYHFIVLTTKLGSCAIRKLFVVTRLRSEPKHIFKLIDFAHFEAIRITPVHSLQVTVQYFRHFV